MLLLLWTQTCTLIADLFSSQITSSNLLLLIVSTPKTSDVEDFVIFKQLFCNVTRNTLFTRVLCWLSRIQTDLISCQFDKLPFEFSKKLWEFFAGHCFHKLTKVARFFETYLVTNKVEISHSNLSTKKWPKRFLAQPCGWDVSQVILKLVSAWPVSRRLEAAKMFMWTGLFWN